MTVWYARLNLPVQRPSPFFYRTDFRFLPRVHSRRCLSFFLKAGFIPSHKIAKKNQYTQYGMYTDNTVFSLLVAIFISGSGTSTILISSKQEESRAAVLFILSIELTQ